MMNLAISAAAPVSRQDVNGVTVTFPKLDSGTLLRFMATWAEEDRKKIIADYAAAGLSGEPLLRELRQHDAESTQPAYGFFQCMGNIGRATQVLAASLKTETIPTLGDAEETCWTAAEIWNQPMYRRVRFPTSEEIEERRAASDPKANGQQRRTIGFSNPQSSDESIPEPTLTR